MLLASCRTSKPVYKPYKFSIPKGFTQLSKTEADSLVKTFAGNFKNVTYYNFYLKDSIVLGLLVNKNPNPDYNVKKQVESNHQVRIRNDQYIPQNAEKYDGYSIEQKNGLELVISNYHSVINGNLMYYKSFLTQTGDDVLRGLVVFPQADSVRGQRALNEVVNSVSVKR